MFLAKCSFWVSAVRQDSKIQSASVVCSVYNSSIRKIDPVIVCPPTIRKIRSVSKILFYITFAFFSLSVEGNISSIVQRAFVVVRTTYSALKFRPFYKKRTHIIPQHQTTCVPGSSRCGIFCLKTRLLFHFFKKFHAFDTMVLGIHSCSCRFLLSVLDSVAAVCKRVCAILILRALSRR